MDASGHQADELRRLIREAVASVVSPDVQHRVLGRALQIAGASEIPGHGRPARVFIREHLRAALLEIVGPEATDGVVEGLSPLMAISTGSEMTGYHEQPQLAAPPALVAGPIADVRAPQGPKLALSSRPDAGASLMGVLVLSMDPDRVDGIERRVGFRASTTAVGTVIQVLDALRDAGGAGMIVVVDCVRPLGPPGALVVAAGDVARGARVLFWGAPPEIEIGVARLDGRAFRCCSAELTPEMVGQLCLELSDGPSP